MTGSEHSSGTRADTGSAVVENLLVTIILTALALAVVQLALTLHVRSTIADAAVEGARHGALAGNGAADAVARTRALIEMALGDGYVSDVSASSGDYRGHASVIVTVEGVLPLVGLVGVEEGVHAVGRAAVESIE